jgi:hydrogenase maturation protease
LHKLLDPFSAIDDRPVKATTLFVGLGSAYGDDQIGWRVAERLAASIEETAVSIRIARSPGDLLDWLEGVDRLIVCDACENVSLPGTILRLRWPNAQLATLCSSSSHDLGLADVLALAEQLCRLPKEVIIWCAQGETSIPGSALSASGQAAVTRLVDKISLELGVHVQAAQ